MSTLERPLVRELLQRLEGGPNLAQVVIGPRQVGKTTALHQVMKKWKGPSHYASADLPAPPDAHWVQSNWEAARLEAKRTRRSTLLVLDEVQKISRWSEVVKGLFDEDRRSRTLVRVVLLGSSSLHVRRGAEESLAGRFELHSCQHWSWPECREAFRWSLDQWLFFGGYPGAAKLSRSFERWSRYVADSLIEAVLSRDVLQLAQVTKPALLRQLFMLAARTPAQIVSFNKMLGQLQDAGNTVTLAHYLHLLESSFLVSGVNVYSAGVLRQRASSPKLLFWNNALPSALAGMPLGQARRRGDWWGRLVENAVGAHLVNQLPAGAQLRYWRDGDLEVDWVLERGAKLVALEVKSGAPKSTRGLPAFVQRYPRARALIIGEGGIPLDTFFSTPPESFL